MNNEKKIEFYKRRSVGEVLSAAAEFIRQNGKMLFKNIFIIGGPLAVLLGYFSHNYRVATDMYQATGDLAPFFSSIVLYLILAMVMSLFLYSMTIAVINHYGEGKLTPQTRWSDLKTNVFSYMKKIFVVTLILIAILIPFSMAIGFAYAGLGSFSPESALGFILILIILLIVFMPGLSLIIYPAIFHQQSAGSSISTAFSLGFRYWGGTFLVVLVTGIVTAVFSYLFTGLYEIWILFGSKILPMGIAFDIVSYILAIIDSLALVIATPILVTFVTFQYFNIVEREDGVSVQSEMDEFDNL